MTIARTKSPPWGVGDKVTSSQINALDINTTYALDKRAGQTDTLSSNVTCASGASVTLASGALLALDSGSTCTVNAGAVCTVASGGQLTVASGGGFTLAPGALFKLAAAGQLAYTAPITKTVLVPGSAARGVSSNGLGTVSTTDEIGCLDNYFMPIIAATAVISARGLLPLVVYTASSSIGYAYEVPLDAFLLDGATLVTATLCFNPNVTPNPGALPATQPAIGIYRTPIAGGPVGATYNEKLYSAGFSGMVRHAAASNAAYRADQQLVFTPNQNNVIDRGAYAYTAVILDEHGANAAVGVRYAGIKLAFSVPTVN